MFSLKWDTLTIFSLTVNTSYYRFESLLFISVTTLEPRNRQNRLMIQFLRSKALHINTQIII